MYNLRKYFFCTIFYELRKVYVMKNLLNDEIKTRSNINLVHRRQNGFNS